MFRRFSALNVPERRLIVETALLLAVVWAGLRVLSLGALRRLSDIYCSRFRVTAGSPATLGRVAWSVRTVSARLPSRMATCLAQAVTADAILRRHGCPSEFHVGVRSVKPFSAHAWVESCGVVVAGGLEPCDVYNVVFPLTRS